MAAAALTSWEEAYAFTLSLNCKLPAYFVGHMKSGSIQLICQAGTTGSFALYASNNLEDTSFQKVYQSQMTADDNGLMWNLRSINWKFVRVQYTGASTNTGTMYARFRKDTGSNL